jgi:hypothetical protein
MVCVKNECNNDEMYSIYKNDWVNECCVCAEGVSMWNIYSE